MRKLRSSLRDVEGERDKLQVRGPTLLALQGSRAVQHFVPCFGARMLNAEVCTESACNLTPCSFSPLAGPG